MTWQYITVSLCNKKGHCMTFNTQWINIQSYYDDNVVPFLRQRQWIASQNMWYSMNHSACHFILADDDSLLIMFVDFMLFQYLVSF